MKSTLLIVCFACAFASRVLCDAPKLRVSIDAQGENGAAAKLVGLLSQEFRKLDSVAVTDTAPELKITCVLVALARPSQNPIGYAASVAVTSGDDRLITHLVQTQGTLEKLAHEITLTLDGTVLEARRRAAPEHTASP